MAKKINNKLDLIELMESLGAKPQASGNKPQASGNKHKGTGLRQHA